MFVFFFVDLFSEDDKQPKDEIEQKEPEPPKSAPVKKNSTSQTVSTPTRTKKSVLMDDDDVTSISDGRPKEQKKKPNLESVSKQILATGLVQDSPKQEWVIQKKYLPSINEKICIRNGMQIFVMSFIR